MIHVCGSVSPENMDTDDDSLFKHATTLTNKQRGNEVTVRPATLDCKCHYNGLTLISHGFFKFILYCLDNVK